jgi:hypothetical protein
MPKLKADEVEIDIDELENAEYNEGGSYTKYDGEIPPAGTQLLGYVKSMWYTYTANDDPMLKVLWVAADNEGDLEEYNGLPVWENLALTAGSKFKWKPFIDQYGLTLRQIKTKMYVSDEEDENLGAPITKIDKWEPGEDNDDAWCQIITSREKYNGNWQAHVDEWLDADADDEDADDEEPDEDEVDETEEEADEEDEAEEEPTTTRRGRRATQATATKTPAKSGRTAKAPAAKAQPARRGRRAQGSSDDPPF